MDWRKLLPVVILLSLLSLLSFQETNAGITVNTVTRITTADTAAVDAFERLRASNPASLFDYTPQYGLEPLLWQTSLTGTATAVADVNTSSIRLRVAASGDIAIRQTHAYFRYQPGKSQLIIMTGVLGAATANTRQRIGYFDAQNGLFFEQTGAGMSVVQRSFTSGSAVDTVVAQASWNLDKLNGTGLSGFTLDTSKSQIFVIDLQWLGVGRVRMGFFLAGRLVYCHQFLNANTITTVYMTTGNLPVRYEHQATGAIGGNVDMFQICSAVISEGGQENDLGITNTANNGITAISVTTRRPVLSIRPKTTFNSAVNRSLVVPLNYGTTIGSGNALVELVYQGTLTGASFTSVATTSTVEADVSATAIAGGTVIDSYYASAASAATRDVSAALLRSKVAITLDLAGSVPDNLTIVVTSFTGTVTANGAITWKESH